MKIKIEIVFDDITDLKAHLSQVREHAVMLIKNDMVEEKKEYEQEGIRSKSKFTIESK